MRIALAEEMRRIDKMAAEVYGIDELLLFVNAGRAAADALTGLLGEIADRTVCILAGSGNNGGDAYAAARHLWSRGARIAIYSVGNAEHMKAATKKNLEICQKLGIPVRPITAERDWEKLRIYLRLADGVLDGILGTGVKGPLREPEEADSSRKRGGASCSCHRRTERYRRGHGDDARRGNHGGDDGDFRLAESGALFLPGRGMRGPDCRRFHQFAAGAGGR